MSTPANADYPELRRAADQLLENAMRITWEGEDANGDEPSEVWVVLDGDMDALASILNKLDGEPA